MNEAADGSSFPSWERGLKPVTYEILSAPEESFPSWERGLKQNQKKIISMLEKSFPSWERGLKHVLADDILYHISRSPRGNVD